MSTGEVYRIIPYVRTIPGIGHFVSAWKGATLSEHVHARCSRRPGATDHALQSIIAAEEAGLFDPGDKSDLLELLALYCSYPSLKVLDRAYEENAISSAQYKDGLADLVAAAFRHGRNHNLRLMDRGLIMAAKKAGAVADADLKLLALKELCRPEDHDAFLVQEAYAIGAISASERKVLLERLKVQAQVAIAEDAAALEKAQQAAWRDYAAELRSDLARLDQQVATYALRWERAVED